MNSPVLTIPETAALLRVSRSTLDRLVARRSIPFFRVGRQVRFGRAALEAWMMGNPTGTPGRNHTGARA